MNKGKRFNNDAKHISFKKIMIIILLLILLLALAYFCFIKKINHHNFSSKSVEGINNILVSDLKIENSDNLSFINITFTNTSESIISSKPLHLYLYDKNDVSVFSTSINSPDLEQNSSSILRIICTKNLPDISNYIIKQ